MCEVAAFIGEDTLEDVVAVFRRIPNPKVTDASLEDDVTEYDDSDEL